MKYKKIEQVISYVELKADNPYDALWEFMHTADRKYLYSSRSLIWMEEFGDFERPTCKITIPVAPNWNNIAIEISKKLRRETSDEIADDFVRECFNYETFLNDSGSEFNMDSLKKVAEPYVKLEINDLLA